MEAVNQAENYITKAVKSQSEIESAKRNIEEYNALIFKLQLQFSQVQ